VQRADPTPDDHTFGIEGGVNFLLLAGAWRAWC
jgi:hypothetical protein